MDKLKAAWAGLPLGLKVVVVAGALMLVASIAGAQGNPMCAPSDVVYDGLESRWGETRAASGLDARGSVIEMFANRDTGTWTMLMTNSAGISCQVASGEGFAAFLAVPNT